MEMISSKDFLFKLVAQLAITAVIIWATYVIYAAGHAIWGEANSYYPVLSTILAGSLFFMIIATYDYINHFDISRYQRLKRHFRMVIDFSGSESCDSPAFQVRGTFKNQPKAKQVYVMEYNPATKEYWPKCEPKYENQKRTWQATISLEGNDQGICKVIIALVGVNSRSLIDYYMRSLVETGTHVPINEFLDDFIVLDESGTILPKK
ncbi:hypothetical protein [Puia dinghuensis]|uniref:Uncharacterized protein n=1 Tax=Puia dinghuensis TaxID=1792502 RepID=A0A8J2XS98_9BACT|nr:hypothetical protein [Puia dinghuensis]GGA93211.1 hypothetical protein GCM10011511_15780 [Puia dinghuensis]